MKLHPSASSSPWPLALLAAVATLLSALPVQGAEGKPPRAIPVILDTDIGTDIDDAFALALAVASPEIELRGVTTVSSDAFGRGMIASLMLYEVGRADVPVATQLAPRSKPDLRGQYQYGLRPARNRPVKERAVEFLYEQLKASPGEITLVTVGDLTNVANLLEQHPECKPWIKQIAIMGGAVRVGYNAKPPAVPEWNVKSDVKSARLILNSGVPLLVAPLDATTMVRLDAAYRQQIFAAGTPLTNQLRILHGLWGGETPVLYDAVALTLVFQQEFCQMEALHLVIDDNGLTRETPGKPNALVATSIRTKDYLDWYTRRIIQHQLVVNADAAGTLQMAGRPTNLADVVKEITHRGRGTQLVVQARADVPAAALAPLFKAAAEAGAEHSYRVSTGLAAEKPNLSQPIKRQGLPNQVQVFEDVESDVEARWWLAGKAVTENLPPTQSASLPNRRVLRGALTRDFDGKQGDQSQVWRAVIFNPVPGPPMGENARLSFRCYLAGTDRLRVQIYSLSKGYHRHLWLTNLPQREWLSLTVNMRDARRPDGGGGSLEKDERIDDIQFYTDADAELLIDDIVLYDQAPADEREAFPRRLAFTGWFDTGAQGREWPGDFRIVLHQAPRTWDAAASVPKPGSDRQWLRISLRGQRPIAESMRLRLKYLTPVAGPLDVKIVDSTSGKQIATTIPDPQAGKWTEVSVPIDNRGGKLSTADEIQLDAPAGAELQVDDLLLYEPAAPK